MRITAAIMVLVIAIPAAAQSAQELIQQAEDAVRAGKLTGALALATRAVEGNPKSADALLLRARIHEAMEHYKDALADLTRARDLDPKAAATYQRRGVVHFKLGNIDASIHDFDRFIELQPDQKAGHWQRGISYYYAGRYDEGRRQFEGYQDVDSNDVENAVWRFMCMARADGLAKARKAMLKIGNDKRVPMRQVYDLFKGELKPDDVLAAARAGSPPKEQLNRQLFYAHLYVGIYFDLLGDRKQALEHLNRAVEHRVAHYMWDVARIHRDLLAKKAVP